MKKSLLALCVAVLVFCALPFVADAQAPTQTQAVVSLRQQLEARAEYITVEFTSETALETPAMDLFWEAVEHTGVPTQGDYIRWHMDKLDYTEDVLEEKGVYHYFLSYTPVYYSTAQEEENLTQAIDALLAELDLTYSSDYRKAYGIYDYICKNVVYDEAAANYSAYDALIDKFAVCQGTAALYYRLALELGLDCRVISGSAGGERHGWNIVKIRDMYYNLDATWDLGATRYICFLKGKNNFYLHIPDERFLTPEFTESFPSAKGSYIVQKDCTGDHSFVAFRKNKDATCIEDGTQTATCEACEVTQTVPLAGSALGHCYGEYIPNGDATMYTDGTKTALCTRCGKEDTQPDPGSRLPKNGWLQEKGSWYFYQADMPRTGWLLYAGDWYYLRANGTMATGWVQYGSHWYYLRPSGAMATGWIQAQGAWYYLDRSGVMKTGWLLYGKDWYYLRSSGAMATGWVKAGNYWYHLGSSGAMTTGTCCISGKTYRFDQNGACLNP